MTDDIDTLKAGGICKRCLDMTLVDENNECLNCRRPVRSSSARKRLRYL